MATRPTLVFATTTVLGFATSIWLYLDNRALREDHAVAPIATTKVARAPAGSDPWLNAPRAAEPSQPTQPTKTRVEPALPEEPKESRMDRRARRTMEIGAWLGRLDGETEDEYRARMVPLIKAGLAGPREKTAEMRTLAEEKAGVTPAQSAQLDKAFEKVYDDVIDYTNKAVTDGQLSPYERNVAGWLEYAGGMGGMLGEAQGQIGKILDAKQLRAMYDSGFEWGEYLGMQAPWERINPPPPPSK
ncbi:MAG: hypothetical protein H0T79_19625 [Deltaproteobacteria bacterium]|nr:hypothetical protein [Deltaproteobacteria bacterium]